jgi:ABC-type glutathione transport system ATPase component
VSRRETEIVEFSELSEFIDKPVKTYSSGMYLRLGFSVATGFEPDVLIIDEALAVGDQHFQKKCTDRILDFRRAGKTILFCSHNLYQVKTLCNRALWLHRGEVRALGSAGDVVDRYTDYLREDHRSSEPEAGARARLDKEQVSWVEKVELTDAEGTVRSQFSTGETLELAVWARFSPAFEGTPGIGVALVRNDGLVIHTTASGAEGTVLKETPEGLRYARVVFPNLSLLSGLYHFNLVTTDQNCLQAYHITERAASFSVTGAGPCSGVVRMAHQWSNAPRPAGSRPELHDRP